jgi:hypothetical protein
MPRWRDEHGTSAGTLEQRASPMDESGRATYTVGGRGGPRTLTSRLTCSVIRGILGYLSPVIRKTM